MGKCLSSWAFGKKFPGIAANNEATTAVRSGRNMSRLTSYLPSQRCELREG